MAPAFMAREVMGTSPPFSELLLEFKAIHSRKPHVEHKAAGSVGTRRFPKRFGRLEHLGPQADGFQQIADGIANRGIVINDEDDGLGVSHRNLADEWVV